MINEMTTDDLARVQHVSTRWRDAVARSIDLTISRVGSIAENGDIGLWGMLMEAHGNEFLESNTLINIAICNSLLNGNIGIYKEVMHSVVDPARLQLDIPYQILTLITPKAKRTKVMDVVQLDCSKSAMLTLAMLVATRQNILEDLNDGAKPKLGRFIKQLISEEFTWPILSTDLAIVFGTYFDARKKYGAFKHIELERNKDKWFIRIRRCKGVLLDRFDSIFNKEDAPGVEESGYNTRGSACYMW